ncbi:MAG TPA: endonuclease III [Candidatus Peribacteraceae bacterium]|nr:endonuclease III [Candidatus Peribacteraceae bacterium]
MQRADGIPMGTVLTKLGKLYHPPKTFLHYRTPLDLLVAVILSAQCTDARVNIVTETILYPKYKRAEDYVKVPIHELEDDIHSCGTFRMKAKSIRGACAKIIEEFGGKVPDTMEALLTLPGVGRKTASVILSAAYGKNLGIAVDTHVQRLAQRLGLSTFDDPKKIELDLMEQAPRKKWRDVTVLLISHGRAVCTARNRKCGACVFKKDCPSSLILHHPDRAKPKKGRKKR